MRRARHRVQRGLSIVELLVGIALGLVIVAAASLLTARHLAESRRLVLETQVQQDLRAAADHIARDLRRAGFWHAAHLGTSTGAGMLPIRHNPYATPPPGVEGATVQSVTYAHAAATAAEDNTVGDAERRGFRLQNGVVEIQLGAGNWQALTDPATLKVTRLDTTTEVERVGLACHRLCSAGATPCPPELELRSLSIAIAGQAVHDPAVQRAVRVRVKLRNDAVVGECRE